MYPKSIAAHPSPSRAVAVAWQSPIQGEIKIGGAIQHVHSECGNGVHWRFELRRGNSRQILVSGTSILGNYTPIKLDRGIFVRRGDLLSVVISPQDSNHACDLTRIDLQINGEANKWNLAEEVTNDILNANPHPDRYGNKAVWHFYSEPATQYLQPTIPSGSLVAQWQASSNHEERQQFADALEISSQRRHNQRCRSG